MKAFFDALKPGDADWALASALDPARLPRHIAIIMDGNGRWANRRGGLDALQIDEDAIAARLYTSRCPDPDLLIRTSGEMRISNFLLWQIAYAELYITGTLWPDFTRHDLLLAVLDYQKRDRRYGGLGTSDSPELESVALPAR